MKKLPKTATEIILKMNEKDRERLMKSLPEYEGFEFTLDVSDIRNRFQLGTFTAVITGFKLSK